MYLVDKEILKRSADCKFNFVCQTDKWNKCKIEGAVKNDCMVEISNDPMSSSCPYLFSYADSKYCWCPTRIAIYKEYGT
ncbi:MAG: hypothetical protein A2V66_02175 [Ignavibacteria bacterium RBG_13_36_8]|nr:MAG: hypothetical protein A2V66_02175 [Ignavibacteria bacterium RBG_13_36_8]